VMLRSRVIIVLKRECPPAAQSGCEHGIAPAAPRGPSAGNDGSRARAKACAIRGGHHPARAILQFRSIPMTDAA
jgi:hypothetical protein